MSGHYLERKEKPTELELVNWANQVLKEAFVSFSVDFTKYKFKYNTRLKTTGGLCRSNKYGHTIEINPKISIESYLYVLLHEISHAVTHDLYGSAKSGHTKEFYYINNSAIRQLGLNGIYKAKRTASFGIKPASKTYSAISCDDRYCSTGQNKPFVMSKTRATNRVGKRCSCGKGIFKLVNIPQEVKDKLPEGSKFVCIVESVLSSYF
jgi:predicted SprT family Zn-dependent metalloprotease